LLCGIPPGAASEGLASRGLRNRWKVATYAAGTWSATCALWYLHTRDSLPEATPVIGWAVVLLVFIAWQLGAWCLAGRGHTKGGQDLKLSPEAVELENPMDIQLTPMGQWSNPAPPAPLPKRLPDPWRHATRTLHGKILGGKVPAQDERGMETFLKDHWALLPAADLGSTTLLVGTSALRDCAPREKDRPVQRFVTVELALGLEGGLAVGRGLIRQPVRPARAAQCFYVYLDVTVGRPKGIFPALTAIVGNLQSRPDLAKDFLVVQLVDAYDLVRGGRAVTVIGSADAGALYQHICLALARVESPQESGGPCMAAVQMVLKEHGYRRGPPLGRWGVSSLCLPQGPTPMDEHVVVVSHRIEGLWAAERGASDLGQAARRAARGAKHMSVTLVGLGVENPGDRASSDLRNFAKEGQSAQCRVYRGRTLRQG
jgi:hypothetical protein